MIACMNHRVTLMTGMSFGGRKLLRTRINALSARDILKDNCLPQPVSELSLRIALTYPLDNCRPSGVLAASIRRISLIGHSLWKEIGQTSITE